MYALTKFNIIAKFYICTYTCYNIHKQQNRELIMIVARIDKHDRCSIFNLTQVI